MTSSCLKLNNLLHLLFKDSCIIVILYLLYTSTNSIICRFYILPESSLWSVSQELVLLRTTPLIYQASGMTQLPMYTTYTMHTCVNDTRIYL